MAPPPAGGGKSFCYRIAAMLTPGIGDISLTRHGEQVSAILHAIA